MSLATAAEDEAAIHHRPAVSSEAVTDKANRINTALAQVPLLCTQTSPRPLQLLFLLKFHLYFFPPSHLLYICPLPSFPGWHHLSVSDYNFCQYYLYLPFCSAPRWTCWYTVELSALTGNGKKWSASERKKRPRPKDYWRPFSLLVQLHLHQTNAYLIFFFRGSERFKLWRCEWSPNRQFKWLRALCSTHKPFQTAVEMLLER